MPRRARRADSLSAPAVAAAAEDAPDVPAVQDEETRPPWLIAQPVQSTFYLPFLRRLVHFIC